MGRGGVPGNGPGGHACARARPAASFAPRAKARGGPPHGRAAPPLDARPEIYHAYRDAGSSRAWRPDEEAGRAFFARYTDFVLGAWRESGGAELAEGDALLDLGCGMGWSAATFHAAGFRVAAADLDLSTLLPEPRPGLRGVACDATRLPFADGSFAVATAHAMLEHVPQPRRVLEEMARVLRPGGLLCIVGPNLLSPAVGLRALFLHAWRHRPLRRVLLRDPEMDRHPTGDTVPEVLAGLARHGGLLLAKSLSRRPSFHFREPDLRPPLGGDKDACYLSNPVDLLRLLPSLGCRVVRNGAPGRPAWTAPLAGGTWIAARKEARP